MRDDSTPVLAPIPLVSDLYEPRVSPHNPAKHQAAHSQSPSEEVEKGFGTGLRAQLERKAPPKPKRAAPEEPARKAAKAPPAQNGDGEITAEFDYTKP